MEYFKVVVLLPFERLKLQFRIYAVRAFPELTPSICAFAHFVSVSMEKVFPSKNKIEIADHISTQNDKVCAMGWAPPRKLKIKTLQLNSNFILTLNFLKISTAATHQNGGGKSKVFFNFFVTFCLSYKLNSIKQK